MYLSNLLEFFLSLGVLLRLIMFLDGMRIYKQVSDGVCVEWILNEWKCVLSDL